MQGQKQNIFGYDVTLIAPNTYMINEFDVSNCYLIIGASKALLIDTGTGYGNLRGVISELTTLDVVVVLTHYHIDHLGGHGCFEEVYLHSADKHSDLKLMNSRFLRKLFLLSVSGNTNGRVKFKDVRRHELKTKILPLESLPYIDLGDRQIHYKLMPGHTSGSVIFWDDITQIVFAGDNASVGVFLFLPHSTSVEQWLSSAKEILNLADNYKIVWGHEKGFIEKELQQKIIADGENLLKLYHHNAWWTQVMVYPERDMLNGCIIFRTGNVWKKKTKTAKKN